jgi:hypothetical protein
MRARLSRSRPAPYPRCHATASTTNPSRLSHPAHRPAVSFKITNSSDHDLDAIQISAAFLDEGKKETFGAATKFLSETSGEAPLPPGYSRTVTLHSSRGIMIAPYSCSAANRPAIDVRVQAKSVGAGAQATLGASQVASEMRDYQSGQ